MATISNLVVNMIARTANFEAGMKKSSTLTKSFQRTVAGVTGTIRNMAVGFLAAAGIGGIGYMIKQTAEMIDNTRDMSIAMGVSTEFLTGMGYAAKQSGASIDEIGNALKFMNKNVFEARSGSKELVKTFNSLGLSTSKLQSMTPEQQFVEIADALSKIPDAAQRTNAALSVFGKGGGGLLPLIMEGKTGIHAMMKEAERLGIVFNGFDAAKVDAMNDSFNSMKMAVQGIANSFVIYIAPYAQAVYETITDMLVPLRNATVDAVAMADRFSAIHMAVVALKVPFAVVRAIVSEIAIMILKTGEAMADMLSWFEGRTGFGWVGDGWSAYSEGFYSAAEDIREENSKLWEQIGKDIKFATGFGNESSMSKFFDDIQRRQKELQDSYNKHPAAAGNMSITEPFKDQKFQEINPSLINVAALNPTQNPMVAELKTQTGLLREIRDGQVA